MISKKDEKILRKMLSLAAEPDAALTYDEMRGFLFGVAVTPDVVAPSEWLPMAFGKEMIVVDSEEEANRLLKALQGIVNKVIERFQNNSLSFPFPDDYLDHKEDLNVIGEWVYGLDLALSLRPDCWLTFRPEILPEGVSEEEYDEEFSACLAAIRGIADPDQAEKLFDYNPERMDELFEVEAELIDELLGAEFDQAAKRKTQLLTSLFIMLPAAVKMILDHASGLERERREEMMHRPPFPPTIRREEPKVGRNDPCPCGSGKKHKKCCLRK